MKKCFLMLVAVVCFGMSTYANCSFSVTNVATESFQSNNAYDITVTVEPSFTPTGAGTYTIVVVPTNEFASVLGSQRMSVTMEYDGRSWVDDNRRVIRSRNIVFKCETKERPICTRNDFKVYECFKN